MIRKWLDVFYGINSKDNEKKDSKIETRFELAENSQVLLEQAAKDTMDLAKEITKTLSKKIDDYASQIHSTSLLINDALILVNDKGAIENFNPAAENIFKWKKSDIIGKCISTIFKIEIKNNFMERFCELVDKKRNIYGVNHEPFMGITKDGIELYVDISSSKLIRTDGSLYYIIIVRDVSDVVMKQKQLSNLLSKNQQLLNAINCSEIGIIITEPNRNNNRIIFCNNGFCNMTDHDRSEIIGKDLSYFSDKIDNDPFNIERVKKDIKNGKNTNIIIAKSKHHSKQWYEMHFNPVYENNSLTYWIGIIYDITEVKKTQDELIESEQHFRSFSEASNEAMVIHNNSRILDFNNRLLELTGYSSEDIYKLHPIQLFHDLERNKITKFWGSNKSSYDTLLLTKDKDIVEISITCKSLKRNGMDVRIEIIKDITHYKNIEKILKSSSERYKTIIDNTIDLVCCYNTDFIITFANKTFCEYFDIDIDHLIGTKILEFIPEKDHDNFFEYVMDISINNPIKRTLHRIEKSNECRWHDWIDRGIFDSNDNLIEYQAVSRDVSHYVKK